MNTSAFFPSCTPFGGLTTSFRFRGLTLRLRQSAEGAICEVLVPGTVRVHSTWPNAAAACKAIRDAEAADAKRQREAEAQRYAQAKAVPVNGHVMEPWRGDTRH